MLDSVSVLMISRAEIVSDHDPESFTTAIKRHSLLLNLFDKDEYFQIMRFLFKQIVSLYVITAFAIFTYLLLDSLDSSLVERLALVSVWKIHLYLYLYLYSSSVEKLALVSRQKIHL